MSVSLSERNFKIVEVDGTDTQSIMTVVSELHPEDPVKIILEDDKSGEGMDLVFQGSPVFTDEEATNLLEEMSDVVLELLQEEINRKKETDESK